MRRPNKVSKAQDAFSEMTENLRQFLPPTEHLRFGTPVPWHSFTIKPESKRKASSDDKNRATK